MNGAAGIPDILVKFANRGIDYLLVGGGLLLLFYGLFGPTGSGISKDELLVIFGLGGLFIVCGFVAFFLKQLVYVQTKQQENYLTALQETEATNRLALDVTREQNLTLKEILTRGSGAQNPEAPR